MIVLDNAQLPYLKGYNAMFVLFRMASDRALIYVCVQSLSNLMHTFVITLPKTPLMFITLWTFPHECLTVDNMSAVCCLFFGLNGRISLYTVEEIRI